MCSSKNNGSCCCLHRLLVADLVTTTTTGPSSPIKATNYATKAELMQQPCTQATTLNDHHNCKTFAWTMLAVVSVALAAFVNSSLGDFVHDDIAAIVNNPDVNGGNAAVFQVFSNDFWGEPMASDRSHKSYRPLTILLFRYVSRHAGRQFEKRSCLQTESLCWPRPFLAISRDQYDSSWLCNFFPGMHLLENITAAKSDLPHGHLTLRPPSHSHRSCKKSTFEIPRDHRQMLFIFRCLDLLAVLIYWHVI